MARKKSFFGTLVKLGGLAAATAAVYYKREEIKEFLTDTATRLFPEDADTLPEETFEAEPDVIIDATAKAAQEEETKEDAPEA